jgi:hypothetical protein
VCVCVRACCCTRARVHLYREVCVDVVLHACLVCLSFLSRAAV